ncbi:hypothetical protein HU200_031485 [Digitaria exilis]|uniref:Serpin domain-containing protein n=1 Tax=Digitaria exilis TaxID=1010633 RepID=A0A835BM28_9POAL|nr:hypothetical protein HU200_031485 [Digitaria exilis]
MDQCLRAIAKESNFLSSPMSLRAGLALLAAGTNGATLRQLLTFLGSEDAHHLAVATARLLADVNTWPQLSFAASVFVDRTLHLTPEFGSAATSVHQAVTRSADFKNHPEAAMPLGLDLRPDRGRPTLMRYIERGGGHGSTHEVELSTLPTYTQTLDRSRGSTTSSIAVPGQSRPTAQGYGNRYSDPSPTNLPWHQLSHPTPLLIQQAIAEVNRFIAQATAWRLTNVLTRDMVGPTTKLVLANGLHFKATWARKFEPSDTVRRHFFGHDDGSRPVRVPFLSAAGMQYAERFDAIGHGFKVLQRFYKMVGRDGKLDLGSPCFCMLVFLPYDRRDGLARLLRMAVAQPDFVMRCAPRREQLVSPCMVPKFRFFSRLEAVSALCQLGLTEPFDKGVADLSRMVSNVPPEGLYVSTVTQTCAVEVDEGGTTAVAAMYAASSPTYSLKERLPRPPPMSFVADHPFMFAIVEYERAEVLFHGHVMDPSKED